MIMVAHNGFLKDVINLHPVGKLFFWPERGIAPRPDTEKLLTTNFVSLLNRRRRRCRRGRLLSLSLSRSSFAVSGPIVAGGN